MLQYQYGYAVSTMIKNYAYRCNSKKVNSLNIYNISSNDLLINRKIDLILVPSVYMEQRIYGDLDCAYILKK